jgi:hypothetical protein
MRADARGLLGALPLGAAQAPSTHNARKRPDATGGSPLRGAVHFPAFRVPAKGPAPCTPRSRRGPGLQQQLQPKTKKKEGPMTKPTLTQDALHQFTGTEHWYRHPVWSKNPSDRLFMRPLDDNNVGARPIARGIGRTALDRGHGSEEIARRCPFLGGCAPHGNGQRIRSGPAAANARQRG